MLSSQQIINILQNDSLIAEQRKENAYHSYAMIGMRNNSLNLIEPTYNSRVESYLSDSNYKYYYNIEEGKVDKINNKTNIGVIPTQTQTQSKSTLPPSYQTYNSIHPDYKKVRVCCYDFSSYFKLFSILRS